MPASGRHIGAAVDVGSNSVHLLVAELTGGGLRYVRDESVLLGLGDVVELHGALPKGTRQAVVGALLSLRQAARESGATSVTFLATEPLRRASNAGAMIEDVRRTLGQRLHVLSERAEGQLTYLGVTGGHRPDEALLVADIGGGSTEVIVARPDAAPELHSLPSGSARLSNGVVLTDPPTPSELERLRAAARSLVAALPAAEVRAATFVGGTATNLVRLVPLSAAGMADARGLFASLTVEQLAGRYGLSRLRASQMPAGAAILESLLLRFRLASAEASQASLRDGAVVAEATLGERWPDRLDELLS